MKIKPDKDNRIPVSDGKGHINGYVSLAQALFLMNAKDLPFSDEKSMASINKQKEKILKIEQ